MRRIWFRFPVAVLVLSLALAGLPLAAPRPAQANVGLVLEALGVLRENYVDRLDAVMLLNGAIRGLRAALSAAGIQADLAEIGAGVSDAQATSAFRAQFEEAVRAAGGRLTPTALAHAAIRGMTAVLEDSHTGFVSPDVNQEFQARARRQAQFSGVGIVLMAREGRFYVRDVVPGSPAAAAGIQPFDRIVRVDNVPAAGVQPGQLAGMIRGPTGTTVTIVVERPGAPGPLTFTVTRAPIRVPPIFQAKILDGGVGYLQLYSFFVDRVGIEFRQTLDRLLGTGMRALVLDVRGNEGGYVHELMFVLNALLPPGRAVFQASRGGQTQTFRTSEVPMLPSHVPLVLLIDGGSASASELLASALQEQGRAVLVGEQTSGAVTAAATFDLSDGSALWVTIMRLASGQGRRLDGAGVSPDVQVVLSVADLDQGRDTQLEGAVQIARQRLGLAAGVPAVTAW
ncbi:MAG: S41 family peptidase [Armatimonadetes bacterium]|nr:S41 family peptidase [Armatimonadota bacterium]